MTELVHRIKVFVFRYRGTSPDYLLLRASGHEGFWGPIQGPIGFGEKLETAIQREVMDDIGISRPMGLLDLQMPGRWLLGDEEVIEWTFGFRMLAEQPKLHLSERWAAFRWAAFNEAYPSLELDTDRAAILRLHAMLSAA
jgi:hypothetical protein